MPHVPIHLFLSFTPDIHKDDTADNEYHKGDENYCFHLPNLLIFFRHTNRRTYYLKG